VGGRRAGFPGLGGDGFEPIHATRTQQQFGPLSAESPGGGGAKTAGGARDQNPFIGEIR